MHSVHWENETNERWSKLNSTPANYLPAFSQKQQLYSTDLYLIFFPLSYGNQTAEHRRQQKESEKTNEKNGKH